MGTLLMSLSKKRAFAIIVSWARVLRRVRETRLDPGSLKAMCPSGPMPLAILKDYKFVSHLRLYYSAEMIS